MKGHNRVPIESTKDPFWAKRGRLMKHKFGIVLDYFPFEPSLSGKFHFGI